MIAAKSPAVLPTNFSLSSVTVMSRSRAHDAPHARSCSTGSAAGLIEACATLRCATSSRTRSYQASGGFARNADVCCAYAAGVIDTVLVQCGSGRLEYAVQKAGTAPGLSV